MNLMSTLHPGMKYVQHPRILPVDVSVGVEIEFNKARYNTRRLRPYWTVHEDGSLRDNGAEFVFNTPLKGKDVYDALTHLFDEVLYDFSADVETSMHVHLDCRLLDDWQLRNLILLNLAYEELLFTGSARYASGFCRMVTSSSKYMHMLAAIVHKLNDQEIAEAFIRALEGNRYYSFTIDSLIRFGSIEYRTFDAPTTPQEAVDKVNIVLGYYRAAMQLPENLKDAITMLTEEADELIMYSMSKVVADEYALNRSYYKNNFLLRLLQVEAA